MVLLKYESFARLLSSPMLLPTPQIYGEMGKKMKWLVNVEFFDKYFE